MRIVLAILSSLFLLLASFMVVLAPPTTHLLAQATVNTEASTMSYDYLVATADAVLDYSLGNDNAALTVGTDDKTTMTTEVLEHLRDVRVVFIAARIAAAIAAVLFAAALIVQIKRKGKPGIAWPLIIGGALTLIIVLILAVVGLLNFDAFFTGIHKVFFADGTWTFSYNSLLICALPQPFWIGCAVVWAVTLFVFCLVSIGLGLILRRTKTVEVIEAIEAAKAV